MKSNSHPSEGKLAVINPENHEEDTLICGIDEEQNTQRFQYTRHQKKLIFLSFLPTHRIWRLNLPKLQLIIYDILYVITISLMTLILAGVIIDEGKSAAFAALVIFIGFALLYFLNTSYQARIIKNKCYDWPGIRENFYEIFDKKEENFWDSKTDIQTKFFLETMKNMKKGYDYQGKLNFKLLHPLYQKNLNNALFEWKTGEPVVQVAKTCMKWTSKDNGLELLYALTRFDKILFANVVSYTLSTIIGVILGILIEWCLMAVVDFDLYGIVLRISVPYFLLVPGFQVGYGVYGDGVARYLNCLNPACFINIDILEKKQTSKEFLIDIFDPETLRTYGILSLELRKVVQGYSLIDIPRNIFSIILTLFLIALGLGLYAIGGEETGVFGYGLFTVFIAFSIIILVFMLGSGFTFGIIFNGRIKEQITCLENLTSLYKQMKNIDKNDMITSSSKKIQFLFDCLKGRNNFDELIEIIEEIRLTFEEYSRKSPYKFVNAITCEADTIAQLFSPLIVILWTAIVHAISLIINLSKRYIDSL